MDHKDIELEVALAAAARRAFGDFQDMDISEDLAIEVADKFMQTWRVKTEKQPQKSTVNSINPAYYLDYLISLATRKIKQEWLKSHLKGKRALSKVDLWFFFIEDLLDYAKRNKSPYMAVVALKVLCDYSNDQVLDVYNHIDQDRYRSGVVTMFSRYKTDYIIPYMTGLYGRFVKVEEVAKGEKRFAKAENFQEFLAEIEDWLDQQVPLYPDCFLPDSFNPNDIAMRYINYNHDGDYPGAAERRRKHIMQCRKCLSKLLLAVGLPDWAETFAPPDVTLPGQTSSGGKAPSRVMWPGLNPQFERYAKKVLGKRNIRRQKLSLRSLFVAVDNGKPLKVRPGRTVRIQLKDGDGGILVSGKDLRGLLLLDTHLVFWDDELADGFPIRYVTDLKDGRSLELTLTYQPDMRSAVAAVTYHSPESESVWKLVPAWAYGGAAAAIFCALVYLILAPLLRPSRYPSAPPAASKLSPSDTMLTVGDSHPPERQPATTSQTPAPPSKPGSQSESKGTSALNSQVTVGTAPSTSAGQSPASEQAMSKASSSGSAVHDSRQRPTVEHAQKMQTAARAKGILQRDRAKRGLEPMNTTAAHRIDMDKLLKKASIYNCDARREPSAESADIGANDSPQPFPSGIATPNITGLVKADGVNLLGVSVTTINIQTHKQRVTKTGKDGRFSFPRLAPGSYAVLATERGYEPAVKGIFEVGQEKGLMVSFDLKRQLGERRGTAAPKLQASPSDGNLAVHGGRAEGYERPVLNSGRAGVRCWREGAASYSGKNGEMLRRLNVGSTRHGEAQLSDSAPTQ